MTPRDFVYWLQGVVDAAAANSDNYPPPPTAEQWRTICHRLSRVHVEIDPLAGAGDPPTVCLRD